MTAVHPPSGSGDVLDTDAQFDEIAAGLRSSKGSGPDAAFKAAAVGAGILVLVILAAIAISTTESAWPAFSQQGLSYFFSTDWRPNQGHYGILGFVWGTAVISLIGVLLAVPTSLGIALFATEVAPSRFRRSITTVMDLLAAVPSVVFGLVGFYVLKAPLQTLYRSIGDGVAGIPVLRSIFGQGSSGTALLTAGIVLAIMITPIITSVCREVFATVPRNDKEGALALGATKWEMIRTAVLPFGRPGVVSAAMLALGRALGETIAVTFIVSTLAAGSGWTWSLLSGGETFASRIANNAAEFDSPQKTGAFIAAGLVLFILTFVVNAVARVVIERRKAFTE